MNTSQPLNKLRALAQRAAEHPRIEAAVVGAIRAELPGVIELLLAEMAQGETVRLYGRKRSQEKRIERDARIHALLEAGMAPDLVAKEVACSRRHVYLVRDRQKSLCKTLP